MADWNWVLPNVALGSAPSRSDIPAMQRQGITDVLDLRGEPNAGETGPTDFYAGSGISYHYDPMRDNGSRQPISAYQIGVSVIRDAIARGGKAYVYCAAGEYRSPSMVYAYLRSIGYSPDSAWSTIRAARPVVQNQYVSSAEAAVPFLGQAPSNVGTNLAIGAIIVGLGGLGWYFSKGARANPRAPRPNPSRPNAGAGVLLQAQDTGRILLAKRSDRVAAGGMWAVPGGHVEAGESAAEAAARELAEELRIHVNRLKPIFRMQSGDFRYETFFRKVPYELHPALNWESTDARWFSLDALPKPLHPGVAALLRDRAVRMKLTR